MERMLKKELGDDVICSFRGEYKFLSNFSGGPVVVDGVRFPSAEAAYQAQKTSDPNDIEKLIRAKNPVIAKSLGKKVSVKPGFFSGDDRIRAMMKVVRAKFAPGTEMGRLLLITGSRVLIEGNTWGDTYFGMIYKNGEIIGQNILGVCLMVQRDKLKRTF